MGLGTGGTGEAAEQTAKAKKADAGVFILFDSTLHPPPNPVTADVAVET